MQYYLNKTKVIYDVVCLWHATGMKHLQTTVNCVYSQRNVLCRNRLSNEIRCQQKMNFLLKQKVYFLLLKEDFLPGRPNKSFAFNIRRLCQTWTIDEGCSANNDTLWLVIYHCGSAKKIAVLKWCCFEQNEDGFSRRTQQKSLNRWPVLYVCCVTII